MKSKLDTILALIALSASDIEEEARTAAHTACRMIREGKFVVTVGFSEMPSTPPDSRPVYPSRAWPDYVRDVPRGWREDEVPPGVKYRDRPWPASAGPAPGVPPKPDFKWRAGHGTYSSPSGSSAGSYNINQKSFDDMVEALKKAGLF